jgi:ribosomal protein L11 methyltransferase
MRWLEVKIFYEARDNSLAKDLIADIFYDCGLAGVAEEEPDDLLPEDMGKNFIRHQRYAVSGYFQKDEMFKDYYQMIQERIEQLEKAGICRCKVVCLETDEADWLASWKDFFWPKKIGSRVVVRPTWREYSNQNGGVVVDIDPGMAFGTGTHPSTCLCVNLIEKYIKTGGSFLDVGSGSGILMIAAAKLGAGKIWATDNDDVAVDIARKNLRLNQIPETNVSIVKCHLASMVTERFDLIAANLSKELVVALLADVDRLLHDDGTLILSGITEDEKAAVLNEVDRFGFAIVDTIAEDGWVALACRLRQ